MILRVTFDDVQQHGTDSGGDIIYYYQGEPFTGIIEEIKNGVLIGESQFINGHRGGIQREYIYPSGLLIEEFYIKISLKVILKTGTKMGT